MAIEPLAKSLCLVLALHAETELCVQRLKSGFEMAQRFVAIEQAARRHVVGRVSVGRPSAARAKSNRSASRGSRRGFDDS